MVNQELLNELLRLLEIRFYRTLTDKEKLQQDELIKACYIKIKQIKGVNYGKYSH